MFMEFSGVEKARKLENRVFIQGLKEGRLKKKNATWRRVLRKCFNSGYTFMRLGKIGVLNSGPRFPLCVLFTLSIAVPGSAGDRESACQCRILSLDGEDPLEESMATHSGILTCRIPLTEEPGKLRLIGWQTQTRLKRLCRCHTCTNQRMDGWWNLGEDVKLF